MKVIADFFSFIANLMTIAASGIALYLFFFKGSYISSVFNALLNYSTQITLTELHKKLDTLNGLKATEPNDRSEILNVLNDISGQLKGNLTLKAHCSDLIDQLSKYTGTKVKITEPAKRALVSEIRETVRHVGIILIDTKTGETK